MLTLSVNKKDKLSQKRMKAGYKAFEEIELNKLRFNFNNRLGRNSTFLIF